MSAYKETLIFCDGDGFLGKECPMDAPYGDGDGRGRTAAAQREGYVLDGWLFRGGKDYCPACAKRLFGYVYKASNRRPAGGSEHG
jgi:hypothetical protein